MNNGFFKQEDVNKILTFRNVNDCKSYLNTIIQNFISEHKKVKSENVEKAYKMINKAKTINDLAFSIQNFILAHPSENLKVIR